MYWLYIYQDKVVHTLEMDGTPGADDWPGTELYDTITQDDSKTFQVGDTFTSDLQLYYNRKIWKDIGWIDEKQEDFLELNSPDTKTGLIDWSTHQTQVNYLP